MAAPLADLGWNNWFQSQLTLEELEQCLPVRVFAVHRSGIEVRGEALDRQVALGGRWFQLDVEARPTVGDWLLLDRNDNLTRVLERKSLLKRMSAGQRSDVQLLAANVDTLFVVTSCNEDFNLARLERYLALAREASVEPVVVLTKADLTDNVTDFLDQAQALDRGMVVLAVDSRSDADTAQLRQWCGTGQTVALLGSSGVGKSTLLNQLAGVDLQRTGRIREEDGKGRHTTTHRSLHLLADGGLVVDSPGIRELAIVDAEQSLVSLFDDVESLALACRFSDCAHEREPGCAVQAAIERGELDERRLVSYRKLAREELYNTESVAERHERNRRFGKMVKQHTQEKKRGR